MKILYIILILILTSCSEKGDYNYTEYTYEIKYDDNTIDTIVTNDSFRMTDMHKCFRNDSQIICDVKELKCIKDTIIRK